VPIADGTACDDGLFCTVDDKCIAGACTGSPNHCGITAPNCRAILCDEETRSCSVDRVADGVPCTSEDRCVLGAVCREGECVGERKTCYFDGVLADADSCSVGACNAATGECERHTAEDGTPCNTLCAYSFFSSGAFFGPRCQAGVCVVKPGTVNARPYRGWDDECNTEACDAAHGGYYRVPRAAGTECNTTDPCNTGACDGAGTCVTTPKNEGGACSDGIACTSNDVCTSGVCKGESPAELRVYLSEPFSGNALGWTTEGPWEIGAASTPARCGNPSIDHTDSADNGIAATAIGDAIGRAAFEMTYRIRPTMEARSPLLATVRVGDGCVDGRAPKPS